MNRRKLLLVCNSYHAFMRSEIENAAQIYEKIVVLCPKNKEIAEYCCLYENVIVETMKERNALNFLPSVLKLFSKNVLLEINRTIKDGKFSKNYFRNLASYLFDEREVFRIIKKYGINREQKQWVALSMWFTGTAYALCRVKNKYPNIKIASLAHSAEVDSRKNAYVESYFKKFCHQKLDYLSFISSNIMDEYIALHAVPNNWRIDNIHLDYLGAKKLEDGRCSRSRDGKYRIVSCSHCVPVKRINLIIDAISNIKGYTIEWVHIGAGPLYEKLRVRVENIHNKNLQCELVGALTNDKVHKFLSKGPIDLMINVSSSEGLPVTLMEAIAYGIPVMATDVGGNSEIVNKNTGILLSENPSTKEISEAIIRMINKNEIEIEELKKSACMEFEQKFNSSFLRIAFYKELSND